MTAITDESGGLPASGRFGRIEEALIRIEAKLDAKADTTRVDLLESRVLEMEKHGSRDAQIALQGLKGLEANVAALSAMIQNSIAEPSATPAGRLLVERLADIERRQAGESTVLQAHQALVLRAEGAQLLWRAMFGSSLIGIVLAIASFGHSFWGWFR
jgi:hypothetical protein